MVIAVLVFLAACAILVFAVTEFASQQNEQDRLLDRTVKIAAETCRGEKALRTVLEVVVLNQPSMDPRVIRVFEDVLDSLPTKCTP